jgi:hypothetical protein
MKGRKALKRKMPKKNNTFGLLARQQAWNALGAREKQETKKPGSNKK